MARPSRIAPEITGKLCEAVRAGNYPEAAAEYAGVSVRTFQRWFQRGCVARAGIYRAFYLAINRAEREAEVTLTALVRKAALKDWRAAAFILERRYRERWAKKEGLEISGELTHVSGVRIFNLPAEEPDPTALAKAAPNGERGEPSRKDAPPDEPTGA